MTSYCIIEAPTPLGLWPSGVELAPRVLLDLGLATGLSASHFGRIEPEAYNPIRDAQSLTLNGPAIARYSMQLSDLVSKALDQGLFPIVLGGDCSALIGPSVSLKRRGRFGLLFMDGHMDFWTPEFEPRGEAASMDFAIVTGHGPDMLTNISKLKPYFQTEDCFAYGARDHLLDPDFQKTPFEVPVARFDLAEARSQGSNGLRLVMEKVASDSCNGFWIHFDVDVLDDDVMPAVDYRMTGGLSLEEVSSLLRTAKQSGKWAGLTITIYNPNLDPSRKAGRALVSTLVEALK